MKNIWEQSRGKVLTDFSKFYYCFVLVFIFLVCEYMKLIKLNVVCEVSG